MPRKAIIIDDDKVTLAMLGRALETAGFAVIMASDGRSGLDLILREVPDLVVTDLLVPRLDGLGVCTAVRKDPRLQRTKIVVITAIKNFALKGEARDCGGDAFLEKPLQPEVLKQTLKRLFGQA